MRRLLCLAGVAAVLASAACRDGAAPTDPTGSDLAPELARAVQGSYIVVFREGTSDVRGLAGQLAAAHGAEITHVYQHAIWHS